MTIKPILDVIHIEFSQMEGTHAFHQIFLNTSSGSDNAINHFMLSKEPNNISHATRSHIGCISQKDCASNLCPIIGITCFFIISFI